MYGDGIGRLGYPWIKVCLSLMPGVRNRLREIVSSFGTDLVYAAWSTAIAPEIHAVKKCFPRLPIVWRILMYPAATTRVLLRLENWYCLQAFESVDGIVFPTPEMRDYVRRTFPTIAVDHIILPEYLSGCYYPDERLPLLSDTTGEPHVVFIGRLDRWRHNDIRPLIHRIADHGMHVHLAQADTLRPHPKIHGFSWIPFGKALGHFLTQFDACLVAYNSDGVHVKDRFGNVIPNRLTTALLGGIPIALHTDWLRASAAFIRERGLGFVFDTAADLRKQLTDRDKMILLRRRSDTGNTLVYDSYRDEITGFLSRQTPRHSGCEWPAK